MKTFRLYAATYIILALAIASSALAQNPPQRTAPQDTKIESITVTDTLPAPAKSPDSIAQSTNTTASGSFTVGSQVSVAVALHDTHQITTATYSRNRPYARMRSREVAATTLPATEVGAPQTIKTTARPKLPGSLIIQTIMRGKDARASHTIPPVTGGRRKPFVVYLYRAMHPSNRRYYWPPQFPLAVLYV